MSIQSLQENPRKDTYSRAIEDTESIWWNLQQSMLCLQKYREKRPGELPVQA